MAPLAFIDVFIDINVILYDNTYNKPCNRSFNINIHINIALSVHITIIKYILIVLFQIGIIAIQYFIIHYTNKGSKCILFNLRCVIFLLIKHV